MGSELAGNRLVAETVKGSEHFLVFYPDTRAGRLAAKQAVLDWLLDLELDFNRQDADQLWGAIDASRFSGRFERRCSSGMSRNTRRRTS